MNSEKVLGLCFILLLSVDLSNGFNLPMPKRKRGSSPSDAAKKLKPVALPKHVPIRNNNDSSTELNLKPKKSPSSSSSMQLKAATMLALETRAAAAPVPAPVQPQQQNQQKFRIFCDMDGVLVDFDAGVRKLSNGIPANNLQKKTMWRLIGRATKFYERLAWMPDGRQLWEAIRHAQPDILTGVPSNKEARTEKYAWCRRELGVEVNHVDMAGGASFHHCVKGQRKKGLTNVITCWSRNKHFESGTLAVLIDDREDLGIEWRRKGGIFIHHTNTETTLKQLREFGIIPKEHETPSGNRNAREGSKENPLEIL